MNFIYFEVIKTYGFLIKTYGPKNRVLFKYD